MQSCWPLGLQAARSPSPASTASMELPVPRIAARQHGSPGDHENLQNMHQKMSTRSMTGGPDHDFAIVMRSHHQAGVDMAKAQSRTARIRRCRRWRRRSLRTSRKRSRSSTSGWRSTDHRISKMSPFIPSAGRRACSEQVPRSGTSSPLRPDSTAPCSPDPECSP